MFNTEISVVIPVYNCAKFITGTLDSLKAQTFCEFEAVIINDGSTDDTEEAVSAYIAANTGLNWRLFNQQNKGIAGARNRGVIEAKGAYIAFLDHDDIWYSQKLRQCYEAFKRYPQVDLVCHREATRDVSGQITGYSTCAARTDRMFRDLLFRRNYLSPSATVVKKEALIEAGLFREEPEFLTVEDYDLWIRLARRCKFHFINEILGEFILSGRSASSDLERHYNNQIRMLKVNFDEYGPKGLPDYWLINFRISKFYLLLARDALRKQRINKAVNYILKSSAAFFYADKLI